MATMACVRTPLAACLFDTPPARLDTATIVAARRHKVDLLLFSRVLRERPEALSAGQRAEATEALRTAAADNQRRLDELLRVLACLDAAGVAALPLKGPALALLLHDDLSVRRSQDLDILVPEKYVDEAVIALRALGYSGSANSSLSREIHLVHERRRLVVDLHWNILDRQWMPFALDFAEIWAKRGFIRLGEATLPVPPPEWLVVATCVYLIKDHPKGRLVYLVDLQHLLARFPDLAWDRAAAIAAASGTRRICALGLALLSEFAGTAIPAPAREHFAVDRTIRAATARVRQALSVDLERPEHQTDPGYLYKVRRFAAHASFRDGPMDRLQICLRLVPLLLQQSVTRWRQRSRRGPASTALVVRVALTPMRAWSHALRAARRSRPAPGTSFHPLDDAGVLFAASSQQLYTLTPSAAFLWCCLEEGYSRRRTARVYGAASGRSLQHARSDLSAMLRSLRSMGLVGVPSGPEVPPQADAEIGALAPEEDPTVLPGPTDLLPVRRRYRLLGSVFEIGFADETLCRAVDPALRHLATTERPDVTGAVMAEPGGFSSMVAGGEVERCETTEALAPLLKGSLTVAAANRREFALYLHAAMLRRGRAVLLLPAAPGGGKTCLTAALARAGFAYHTDEVTLLDRGTLCARGAPVALSVKDGGWPILAPLYPEINGLATHQRCDGKFVRYLPPPVDPGDPALDRSYPVRWIVFPSYTPEGPTRIDRVPPVDAIRLLLDECLALRIRLDSRVVQALVDWIASIECHVLIFNDLHAAVLLIESVCGTLAGLSPADAGLGAECPAPV